MQPAVCLLLLSLVCLPACGERPAGGASAPPVQTSMEPAETLWEALIPPHWDPQALFKDVDLAAFDDNDPRAQDLLLRLRQTWDNAPVNMEMQGRQIRIPGYVVPLDPQADGVREFLLVPYFGACIHTPPPPANQIIHVRMAQPLDLHAMSTVWVSGRLEVLRSETEMGKAGYQVREAQVRPYAD